MANQLSLVAQAADYIRQRCPVAPTVGIVLGSGLMHVANGLAHPTFLPYEDIPGFPKTSVQGHPGKLALGTLNDHPTAVLVGRAHFYEGYSMHELAFPVRVLRKLGCETLIVTNAAGGLNPLFWPGDLMMITDHINMPGMAGLSPLSGPESVDFGPRFLDTKASYDREIIELAVRIGHDLGIELRRGVYAMVAGPSYETLAEVRLLRAVGADAIGMSTVPEVLAARQGGMRVAGISCITNLQNATAANVTHDDVIARSQAVVPLLTALINELIWRL